MKITGHPIALAWHQYRHRIALACAILAGGALAGWGVYAVSYERQLVRVERASGPRLDRFATVLFAPPARYTYLPHLLANFRTLREALEQPSDPELVRKANVYLNRLQHSTGATALYLLDPQGTAIASSNWQSKGSFVGKNYAFRPYYTRALEEGGAHFYAMGVTSRTPGFFLSQLVKVAGTDEVLGVAVVKVDLTMPSITDGSGEILVTDSGGVAFLSSRKDWQYRPLNELGAREGASVERTRQYEGVLRAPLNLHIEQQLESGAAIVALDENGRTDRFFMARRPVPETDWHVNVLLPLEDIETTALRLAVITAISIVLVATSLMYLWEFRLWLRERERSRTALENAHGALARQHEELKALSEELRVQSFTDSLTGLFNRRYFMESAERMLGTARRHGEPLALMVVDADHFKRINDEHGHPAGDEVLRVLARVLLEETRDGDVVARYGGEEFIVALPRTGETAALAVAERMRERIVLQKVVVPGGTLSVTVSIGVAVAPRGAAHVEELIRRADAALYEAKRAGRNRVQAADLQDSLLTG
ncbi:sensor domain-containing diguanylate cyclase [Pseudoduganella flava]|nr:sensor domain-containing diguanylate cyclase [Pseudoduganella flava]